MQRLTETISLFATPLSPARDSNITPHVTSRLNFLTCPLRVNPLHSSYNRAHSRSYLSTIYRYLRIVIDLYGNSVTVGQTRPARVGSSVIHQIRPTTRSGVLADKPPISVPVHGKERLGPRRWVRLRNHYIFVRNPVYELSKQIERRETHHTTVRSRPRRKRVLRNERRRSSINYRQRNSLEERVSRDPRPKPPADQSHIRLGRRTWGARACLYTLSHSLLGGEAFRTRNSRIKCHIRCEEP